MTTGLRNLLIPPDGWISQPPFSATLSWSPGLPRAGLLPMMEVLWRENLMLRAMFLEP
jgi:hypothetical protein